MCMGRTNIDLNDDLIEVAMRRYGLRTKKDVVDLALRRLVGPPLDPALVDRLEGAGWDGDLNAMRAAVGAPSPE